MNRFRIASLVLACGMALPLTGGTTFAQSPSEVPHELEGVDIVEKINAELPLDAEFVDQSGDTIKLGDLFTGERPVLLQMGYFKCPQLCNLVLNEMTETLRKLDWTTGKEFDVVSISINPEESPELAAAQNAPKKQLPPPSLLQERLGGLLGPSGLGFGIDLGSLFDP